METVLFWPIFQDNAQGRHTQDKCESIALDVVLSSHH